MPQLIAIRAALGMVPRWVWMILLAAIAVHFALSWHAGKVKAHDVEVVAARDAQWQARFDEMRRKADEVRAKAENLGRKISNKLKDQHDAQVRHNASDANDLRLRGPGQAAAAPGCRPVDRSGLPAASGGAGGPGGGRAAAAGPLSPSDRLALVPWSWLVDHAQQSDDSRAEVITWRNWYVEQSDAWEKMRGDGKKTAGALEPVPK